MTRKSNWPLSLSVMHHILVYSIRHVSTTIFDLQSMNTNKRITHHRLNDVQTHLKLGLKKMHSRTHWLHFKKNVFWTLSICFFYNHNWLKNVAYRINAYAIVLIPYIWTTHHHQEFYCFLQALSVDPSVLYTMHSVYASLLSILK